MHLKWETNYLNSQAYSDSKVLICKQKIFWHLYGSNVVDIGFPQTFGFLVTKVDLCIF